MNINTNILLNSLLASVKSGTKIDSSTTSELTKLISDGKVDLSTLVKDKGIQTFLQQMFKDISTGIKDKSDVASLLENSKNSLKFKNIATDLKELTKLLQKELHNLPSLLNNSTNVEKLLKTLQNSLVDIKTLDEKVIQNKVSNSGVFLESKIANQTNSISKNLTLFVGLLKESLTLLSNLNKDIGNNLPQNKQTITSNTTNMVNQTQVNISNSINSSNISDDIKLQIQTKIQNILKTIESSQQPNLKIEKSISLLQNATEQIDKLEKNITQQNIKNDITTNLKEAVYQVKNNFILNSFLGLKKAIVLIQEQIQQTITTDQKNTQDIKQEVKNIDQRIQNLIQNQTNNTQESKIVETKITNIKEILTTTNKILDNISNFDVKEFQKNNLGNIKNIQEDLKSVLLQLKEIVEKNNNTIENQPKELRLQIDKLLSQIDFYQLSSFSSNSNHSFISFLQEDLEDVDIKFNNKNNDEFSCMINLSLQQFGELKIYLQLDKKNALGINIGVEQQEFKHMIQESLQDLRKKINSIGLALVSLNVFDLEEEKNRSDELKAYNQNQDLDFGLDIKV